MPDLPTGTVTFLFTNIDLSRLRESSPGATKAAQIKLNAILRSTIEASGGYIFKATGGTFGIAFSTPYEALSAAIKAQRTLLKEDKSEVGSLRVSMVLHTGSVEEHGGTYTGSALQRLTRLLSTAHGDQILLSFVTAELVRDLLPDGVELEDLGEHRLNDLMSSEHLFQLVAPDLPANFPPLKTLEALPNNLPLQLTSFIGREQEMAEIKGLLHTTRLLTLTGSGGAGKTRLALQAAADVLENFRDGVWLVELASLFHGDLVAKAAGSTLGMREEVGRPLLDSLSDYLRSKHLLIVLDNCEHLIEACATLAAALLRTAPNVHILATSREALDIGGEITWRVPSLSLPSSRRLPTFEQMTQYEAIQLFIERATAVQPGFKLTEANAPIVAQICQRLEGIPLAIELAAARVRMLSVEQIALRLKERFLLLTGGSRTALPRQQTLRATVDWSYDLLSVAEQAMLRRLSVFAGGWTLEAAEAVCADEQTRSYEVLDLLTQLVNKSLVIADEQEGEIRYRLLETIRQYAQEKLREVGKRESMYKRHWDWFLQLAEEAISGVAGSEQALWLERLEREHDNLRAALRRSLKQNEVETALRLAGALWWFWSVHGHATEGRKWLESALARSEGVPASVRAHALNGAGMLALSQDDHNQTEVLCGESLRLFRELGDKRGIALSLWRLGIVAWIRRNFSAARSMTEESLALSKEVGNKDGIADSLNLLGYIATSQGQYDTARALLEQGLVSFRQANDQWGTAYTLYHLAQVLFFQGEYVRVHTLLDECLLISRKLGYKRGIADSLNILGRLVLYEEGDAIRAYSLAEESLATFRELGDRVGISEGLSLLGKVATFQRNYAAARAFYEGSLAISKELEDKQEMASCLEGLGEVAAAQASIEGDEQVQRTPTSRSILWAARLWGAAEAIREAIGAPMPPVERRIFEHTVAAARTQLGVQSFTKAWAEGRSMTPEQALESEERVLLIEAPLLGPSPTHPAGLTEREVEVLRLVAQGLTDSQVAEKLVLSPRTVSTHLRSIYNKLGITSRSAATRFAMEHNLT